MEKPIYTFLFILGLSMICKAQLHNNIQMPLSINPSGDAPSSNTIVDISSTNLGLLLPTSTGDQINLISNTTEGLMFYNTDNNCLWMYHDGEWLESCSNANASLPPSTPSDQEYILLENYNGAAEWKTLDNLVPTKVSFSATDHAKVTLNNYENILSFGDIQVNTHGNFQDNTFAVPFAGYYYFVCDISMDNTAPYGDDTLEFLFFKNGDPLPFETLIDPAIYTQDGKEQSASISGIVKLNANDKITSVLTNVNGDVRIGRRTFSGHLISKL